MACIWYPRNNHADFNLGKDVRYYLGSRDFYGGSKTLNQLIHKENETPFVIIRFPISDFSKERIEEKLQKHPVSVMNTCMGSVAEIINRISPVKIPFLVRQSPEWSALYCMMRSKVFHDVTIEYHGISSKEAYFLAIKNGSMQLGSILVVACLFFHSRL